VWHGEGEYVITLRYIVRKIVYMSITLYIAITFNFLLPRLIPGNPAVTILLSRYKYLPPGKVKLLENEFHLTGTLWQQYVGYLTGLVHGNLGVSYYFYPESVSQIIMTHLPWTLFLLGTATIISVLIGVSYGSFIGWRSGSRTESLLSSIAVSLTSVPYFWLGLIFQLVFAVMIIIDGTHIFPVAQAYSYNVTPGPNLPFIESVAWHAALPLITLVITSYPGFALIMRNTMTTALHDDYILMANAKGLTQRRIMKRYASRNAILPVATSIALSFAYIVGGAFLVEVIFSYPGIGYTLYNAVTVGDYPLMQGVFLIITTTVILANFLVDIMYAFLDPRVSLK
jgi:peptide/nickel transport system permease protein